MTTPHGSAAGSTDVRGPDAEVLGRARTGVVLSFATNGMLFASFVSRLPDIRSSLGLSNGGLGLLLLAASVGSVGALPVAGALVLRWGAARVVRGAATACAGAMVAAALGTAVVREAWAVGLALAAYGAGTSLWDVAMNVEGAEVERRRRRTLMPQLHAMWSVGSIGGSLLGVPMAAAAVPLIVHIVVVAAVVLGLALASSRAFLPVADRPDGSSGRPALSAWCEPRTLLLGLMVFCFAAVEGSANDWLTLAVIDGYHTPHWVGVACYSVFVVCMTLGRFGGARLLDRYGRRTMLWCCAGAALAGILLTVYAGALAFALVGIAVWGLGGALGFPVGMSAAADDPERAPARVSVVSTIGYGAFLAFPPLLGALGDHVGTLDALLVIAALMLPAAAAVLAARPPQQATQVTRRTGA